MIFLDTNVLIKLSDKREKKLPLRTQRLIEEGRLWASPMAFLEIRYLHNIRRIKDDQHFIFSYLQQKIGLELSQTSLDAIISAAMNLDWTRDLFDRLIVAECIVNGAQLITRDTHILEHYPKAIWD